MRGIERERRIESKSKSKEEDRTGQEGRGLIHVLLLVSTVTSIRHSGGDAGPYKVYLLHQRV